MKKFMKIAPGICALGWAVVLVLAVFNKTVNYRTPFIITTTMLILHNLAYYFKENEDVRPTERDVSKQGRESEHNDNSPS